MDAEFFRSLVGRSQLAARSGGAVHGDNGMPFAVSEEVVGDDPTIRKLSLVLGTAMIGAGLFNSVAVFPSWRQAGAVTIDRPDEDAYGRVTNPERFLVVVDAAAALIDELVETFEVTVAAGSSAVDFPNWRDPPTETTRLVPSAGAPLALLFTDFPGVHVRFGEWGREAFPGCGCDACDEQPADVIERMHRVIGAIVEGTYEEQLTKRTLRYSFTGKWGGQSNEARLERGEWRHHGKPGAHRWPPWPRRQRS